MSMQIVLRIHRTMTGEEIDRAIATVVAGQALALERVRRAAWRRTVQNAASFATSLTTVAAATSDIRPKRHGRVKLSCRSLTQLQHPRDL
jgi:hypothetical protein